MKTLLLLAFFLLTPSAHAAIDYATSSPENNNSGTNTGITSNPLSLSGTNPFLACYVFTTAALTNLAVTFDGASMTAIGSPNNYNAGSHLYAFGLLNPTTGSYKSAIATWDSLAGVKAIHCSQWSGVSQSALPSVTQNNSGSGTSFNVSLTTDNKANSWVIMVARNDSNTFTAGTGTTIRSQVTGDALMWADSGGTVAASSPYSMAASWTGSASWGTIQIEISPPSAAETFKSIPALFRALWIR